VTEAHLVLASGLFGDFNPLHVDEEFAEKQRGEIAVPAAGKILVASQPLSKPIAT
jgi:acyl dehydratase